jgi:nucleotide-binding universal stress UspA family protein
MQVKKIVVPTDFSESSEYALDVAVLISQKTGWSIMLLNVMKSKDLLASTIKAMQGDGGVSPLLSDAKRRLELLRSKSKYNNITIDIDVALQNDISKLTETIAATGANLIVMGTKALDGYEEEKPIGDNTRALIKNAVCPVIVVKNQMTDIEIKTAVFTTNFGKNHKALLSNLAELFNLMGTKVYLLCVSTPDNFITTTKYNHKLSELVAESGIHLWEGCLYNDISREEGILNFAQEQNIDLLIMPTKGRTGLRRFINDSIAENTLDHYSGLSMTIFEEM